MDPRNPWHQFNVESSAKPDISSPTAQITALHARPYNMLRSLFNVLRSLVLTNLIIKASALTPSTPCEKSRRRRLQTRRPLVTEAVDLDACLSSDDALEPLYATTPEHGYARCPDCTAPVDVVSVDALLSARAFHRECRNYAEADLLLEQLRAVCGVVVDDEKMSWRYSDRAEKPAEAAEASLPAFDGDAAALDAALINAVEAILRRRAAAQLAKDYVVADALRDELRAEYNVAVHDRDGRWRLLEPTKRRLV